MEKSDWKVIGYTGAILGLFFLIGAMFCYFYSETYTLWGDNTLTGYPHRERAVPLLITGVFLLVIGLGCLWRAKQEK